MTQRGGRKPLFLLAGARRWQGRSGTMQTASAKGLHNLFFIYFNYEYKTETIIIRYF